MKSVWTGLEECFEKKRRVALATIIGVEGSAPQVVGASALFSAQGLVEGTLGGGLLEAWAGRRAAAALRERRSEVAGLDLGGELGSGTDAVCGGAVTILIDAAPADHAPVFRRMEDAVRAGRRGVLVTRAEAGPGPGLVLGRRWIPEGGLGKALRGRDLRPFAGEVRRALRRAEGYATRKGTLVFAELREPRPRLIIAGAGHIGRALCRLASGLDFEVAVADDRPEFACPSRLPEADLIVAGDIARSVTRLSAGREPYIVIVTRGHSRDAEVLRACIRRPAAYVGMIGSRRKVALMRHDFLRNRWATGRQFDGIAAPVGLEIKARTVEEIAVSIAAQIVLRRRSREEGRPGREPWFGP
jgi:xanthine dehydrogenase accessory factor